MLKFLMELSLFPEAKEKLVEASTLDILKNNLLEVAKNKLSEYVNALEN